MSDWPIVTRLLAWSISTDAAAKASVLALAIVAARALEPERFAQFVGFVAVMLLAAAIWDFGVSPLIAREVANGRMGTRSSVLEAARLRVFTLPLWLAAFALGSLVMATLGSVEPAALAIFALSSLVSGARLVFAAVLQGLLAFRAAGLALASGRFTTAVAALTVFAVDSEHRMSALAVAVLAGEVLAAASTVALVRRRSSPRAVEPPSTLSLRASAPFAASGLMATAYNRLDIVLVAALTTTFQASLYAPASRVQDALLLLPASIGAVALPVVARGWRDSPATVRRNVRRLSAVGFAITFPAALFVAIFAPSLLRVILGDDYAGAAGPVRILVWSVVLSAVSAPLIAGLAGIGRAGDATKAVAVALGTAVIAHLSLDWWWGATGAAVATFLREPAMLATAALLAARAGLLFEPRTNRGTSSASGVTSANEEPVP